MKRPILYLLCLAKGCFIYYTRGDIIISFASGGKAEFPISQGSRETLGADNLAVAARYGERLGGERS
jgi:hypothetical protein